MDMDIDIDMDMDMDMTPARSEAPDRSGIALAHCTV